jgi:aminobenzoyl-glutamate utilization protein A
MIRRFASAALIALALPAAAQVPPQVPLRDFFRNPDRAFFRMETRAVTDEINAYMVEKARDIIDGAARMYGLGVEMVPAAVAVVAENSPALVALGEKVAAGLPSVKQIVPFVAFNASEDITILMQHVQNRGGQALAALFGTPVAGGHHNPEFDIDEEVIVNAAEFYLAMYREVSGER